MRDSYSRAALAATAGNQHADVPSTPFPPKTGKSIRPPCVNWSKVGFSQEKSTFLTNSTSEPSNRDCFTAGLCRNRLRCHQCQNRYACSKTLLSWTSRIDQGKSANFSAPTPWMYAICVENSDKRYTSTRFLDFLYIEKKVPISFFGQKLRFFQRP